MFALAGIGTLLSAVSFFPGYLNGDSNWQYAQGLSGQFDDMHPVLMSWLMGRLDGVVEGIGVLFLLMAAAFWAGLGSVLRTFTPSRSCFWIAAALIGTSIPIFSMLSQHQKDLGMVVGLLGSFALLAEAERRPSLPLLLSAAVPLGYAIAVRHNALVAALPFACWMGWLLARDCLPPALASRLAAPWRRMALGLLILATLFGASQLATWSILGDDGKRTPISQITMAYDMVGISVRSGHYVLPRSYYPKQPFSIEELRAIYRDHTCVLLFWHQPELRKVPFTRSPKAMVKIRRAWLRAIAAEPAAYLAHRHTLFLSLLGFRPGVPVQKIEFRTHFDYRGPTVFELPHARALVSFYNSARRTLFFRSWPYLGLGLLALGWAWWRPNRYRLAITLLAGSAALHIGALAFVGAAAQFRYMWWPVLAAMLQVTLAVMGRPSKRDDAESAGESARGSLA